MKCSKCQQDMLDDQTDCLNCHEDEILNREKNSTATKKIRKIALFTGIISFGFGLLFGGFYFPVLSFVLGMVAIVLSITNKKNQKTIYLAGLVFGLLGSTFGSLSFASAIANENIAKQAHEIYSQEMQIQLPNEKPDFYFIAFGLFSQMRDLPKKEFHYHLNEVQANTLNQEVLLDNRFLDLPFEQPLQDFLLEFNLDLDYLGKYLLYDRISDQFGTILNLNDYRKHYDFVLIIFDYDLKTLVIYDVYQS